VSDIDTLINRLSDRQRHEFALWCAERVRALMSDPRSKDALDVAARHLRGEATDEELVAARNAASAAAWAAAEAAAPDAAWNAAWDAAWNAARDAAWDAEAAACDATAAAAAADAAWDTERAAQLAELERMLGEVTP